MEIIDFFKYVIATIWGIEIFAISILFPAWIIKLLINALI